MALEVITDTGQQDLVVSTERLWLTADKESVVPDGHEDAAFLLVGAGGSLPREDAERYGLLPATDASADLHDLTVAQLKDLADDEGVDRSGLSKKDDLVAAIELAREAADDENADG